MNLYMVTVSGFPKVFVRATSSEEALKLYKRGLTPNFIRDSFQVVQLTTLQEFLDQIPPGLSDEFMLTQAEF
jgi:hypothetical protein